MRYLIDCSNYFAENFNLGDAAIFSVMIDRIRSHDRRAVIRWITRNPTAMEKIGIPANHSISVGEAIGRNYFCREISAIERTPWPWNALRFRRKSSETRFLASIAGPAIPAGHAEIHSALVEADVVLATGGGYFSDAFSNHAIGVLDTLAAGVALGRKTALFGIGFEPLTNPKLIEKAARILPRLQAIGCREQFCGPPLLQQWQCAKDRIVVTGDDAIDYAYRRRPSHLGAHLGVNLRKASYAGIKPESVDLLAGIVQRFSRAKQIPLLSLPISTKGPADQNTIRQLIGSCGIPDRKAPTSLDKLMKQLNECRVAVVGSYHAAVFALSQGIPVVALANSLHYQTKLDGLSHQFGSRGCRVISLADEHHAEKIEETLHDFWENALHLRLELLACAESQITSGRKLYHSFLTGR